ncbi:unnamed protein product [Polarella glacialis]|uniref:Cyclic nucleotide-binding domain-containing protein n=1 Tax=Polarella glacialis TaxID=89957 RepID=A0A813IYB1_POLGL|nr:unnamed protein product [Polarella glacialis]CAE8661152.1 unnamed protein product [Polarella glacialis]
MEPLPPSMRPRSQTSFSKLSPTMEPLSPSMRRLRNMSSFGGEACPTMEPLTPKMARLHSMSSFGDYSAQVISPAGCRLIAEGFLEAEGPVTGGIEVARECLEQLRRGLGLAAATVSPANRMSPKQQSDSGLDLGAEEASAMPCGALSAEEISELDWVLSIPAAGGGFNLQQAVMCVELCTALHFFKRLTLEQQVEVVSKAKLEYVQAGSIIYKEGDPLGTLFVVLVGSVVVEQAGEDLGGRVAFATTIYDGKAFGDRWDHGGEGRDPSAGRWSKAIAQEDCRLLVLNTPDYLATMTTGEGPIDNVGVLTGLNFLEACSQHDLEMLSLLLESKTWHHGEHVLSPGEHPNMCHILFEGDCQLRTAERPGRPSLPFKALSPGACFGLGALLDSRGVCSYPARAVVVVDSIVAQFYLLGRRSLLLLPDVVQDKILQRLELGQQEDPICEDGREVTQQHLEWRHRKRQILAEEARCSENPSFAVRPESAGPRARWLLPGSDQLLAASAGKRAGAGALRPAPLLRKPSRTASCSGLERGKIARRPPPPESPSRSLVASLVTGRFTSKNRSASKDRFSSK